MARLAWVSLLGLLLGGCIFSRSGGHAQQPRPRDAATGDAPADLAGGDRGLMPPDRRLTDRGPAAIVPERHLAVEGIVVPDLPPAPPDLGPDSRAWPDSRGWPDYRAPDLTPPCGPATCTGCCSGNACQTGSTNEMCGKGGAACASCTSSARVCSAGACTTCTQHIQCSGDTLCIGGGCVPAYGRKYSIGLISASIAAKKGNGSNWDTSYYPYSPDPYAQMNVAGGLYFTSIKSDSFNPVWNQWASSITLNKSTPLKITVSDDDGYTDDQVGTFTLVSVPLSALREGTFIWKPDDPFYTLKQFELAFEP